MNDSNMNDSNMNDSNMNDSNMNDSNMNDSNMNDSNNCNRIAIISGVGVMNYYKKLNYYKGDLENGDYMIKNLLDEKNILDSSKKIFNKTYYKDKIIDVIKNWENSSNSSKELYHHYGIRCPHASLIVC